MIVLPMITFVLVGFLIGYMWAKPITPPTTNESYIASEHITMYGALCEIARCPDEVDPRLLAKSVIENLTKRE